MTRRTDDERLRLGGNSSFKGAIRQERTMRSIRRIRETPRRGISIDKGRTIKLVVFTLIVPIGLLMGSLNSLLIIRPLTLIRPDKFI